MSSGVYVALGSNLNDPPARIEEAIVRLDAATRVRVVRRARVYRTAPLGPPGQPHFANTVVEVETTLSPRGLLGAVKRIEATMGRVKTVRWGPRVIDLDILLYGSQSMKSPSLTIPHVELAKRDFVLLPLFDLAPDLVVPGTGQTVRALLAALPESADPPQPVGNTAGAGP